MKTLENALQKVLTVCACYYLAAFCVAGVLRMPFPGALEWLESNMYYQVLRVTADQPLYVEPSLEYVPFPYPPLYCYLSALVADMTGAGFLPLRLVSFVCALGSMALIGYIVFRESSRRSAGLWAAGLFAATYTLSATYFDVARVDSLFLFLFLGSLAAIRFAPGIAGAGLAAILLACATLTKQTGFVLCVPLLAYVFLFRPRNQAFCCAGIFFILTGLLYAGLNVATQGWYFFYVFSVPGRHAILWDKMGPFWVEQIIRPLGIAAGMAVGWFVVTPLKKQRAAAVLYGCSFAAIYAATCMHWMKIAAYKNVLMPAHAALAIGVGFAVLSPRLIRFRRLLLAATCVQFALLCYNPLRVIPPAGSAEIVRSAVAAVKDIDGEVFAPANGYLPVLAGKPHSAHISCINDIIFAGPDAVRDRLLMQIGTAIRTKRFAAIVLDRPFGAFERDIELNYALSRQYTRNPVYSPLIRYWYVPRLLPGI